MRAQIIRLKPYLADYENPAVLHRRRLPPRADFALFPDARSARRMRPETSSRRRSLDGDWRFCYCDSPAAVPVNFQAPAFNDRAWRAMPVPGAWQMHGIDQPQYTNSCYPFLHPPHLPGPESPSDCTVVVLYCRLTGGRGGFTCTSTA